MPGGPSRQVGIGHEDDKSIQNRIVEPELASNSVKQTVGQTIQKGRHAILNPGFEINTQIGTPTDYGRKNLIDISFHNWWAPNIRKQVYLKIRSEWIRRTNGPRHGRTNQITNLNGLRGNSLKQMNMILRQKIGEVVKKNQQNPQNSFVKRSDRFSHIIQTNVRFHE